jgi:hypothetical protein
VVAVTATSGWRGGTGPGANIAVEVGAIASGGGGAWDRTNSLELGALPPGAPSMVQGPEPDSKPSASTVPPDVVNLVSSMNSPSPPVPGALTYAIEIAT